MLFASFTSAAYCLLFTKCSEPAGRLEAPQWKWSWAAVYRWGRPVMCILEGSDICTVDKKKSHHTSGGERAASGNTRTSRNTSLKRRRSAWRTLRCQSGALGFKIFHGGVTRRCNMFVCVWWMLTHEKTSVSSFQTRVTLDDATRPVVTRLVGYAHISSRVVFVIGKRISRQWSSPALSRHYVHVQQ